jgi:hypothetical protein
MENNCCERCGIDFEEKKRLVQHLKRKRWCIAIENDIDPNILLEALTHKEGIICVNCNKIYASKDSLRRHKCSSITPQKTIIELKHKIKIMKQKCSKDISNIKFEDLQQQVLRLQEDILNIRSTAQVNNTQISNTLIDNSITNNITVNINSLKSPSVQQIQHLLDREDTTELFMNCLKSIDGIKKYINTKYYDPNHPENQMIRKSDNQNELELYEDKWKKYDNMDASDLILINIGNDLTHYLDSLLENDEEKYEQIKQNVSSLNKMLMVHFNIDFNDNIDNDNSEEWGRSGHPKLINGSYVWIDDKDVKYEKEKRNKEKIQKALIKHIHQK